MDIDAVRLDLDGISKCHQQLISRHLPVVVVRTENRNEMVVADGDAVLPGAVRQEQTGNEMTRWTDMSTIAQRGSAVPRLVRHLHAHPAETLLYRQAYHQFVDLASSDRAFLTARFLRSRCLRTEMEGESDAGPALATYRMLSSMAALRGCFETRPVDGPDGATSGCYSPAAVHRHRTMHSKDPFGPAAMADFRDTFPEVLVGAAATPPPSVQQLPQQTSPRRIPRPKRQELSPASRAAAFQQQRYRYQQPSINTIEQLMSQARDNAQQLDSVAKSLTDQHHGGKMDVDIDTSYHVHPTSRGLGRGLPDIFASGSGISFSKEEFDLFRHVVGHTNPSSLNHSGGGNDRRSPGHRRGELASVTVATDDIAAQIKLAVALCSAILFAATHFHCLLAFPAAQQVCREPAPTRHQVETLLRQFVHPLDMQHRVHVASVHAGRLQSPPSLKPAHVALVVVFPADTVVAAAGQEGGNGSDLQRDSFQSHTAERMSSVQQQQKQQQQPPRLLGLRSQNIEGEIESKRTAQRPEARLHQQKRSSEERELSRLVRKIRHENPHVRVVFLCDFDRDPQGRHRVGRGAIVEEPCRSFISSPSPWWRLAASALVGGRKTPWRMSSITPWIRVSLLPGLSFSEQAPPPCRLAGLFWLLEDSLRILFGDCRHADALGTEGDCSSGSLVARYWRLLQSHLWCTGCLPSRPLDRNAGADPRGPSAPHGNLYAAPLHRKMLAHWQELQQQQRQEQTRQPHPYAQTIQCFQQQQQQQQHPCAGGGKYRILLDHRFEGTEHPMAQQLARDLMSGDSGCLAISLLTPPASEESALCDVSNGSMHLDDNDSSNDVVSYYISYSAVPSSSAARVTCSHDSDRIAEQPQDVVLPLLEMSVRTCSKVVLLCPSADCGPAPSSSCPQNTAAIVPPWKMDARTPDTLEGAVPMDGMYVSSRIPAVPSGLCGGPFHFLRVASPQPRRQQQQQQHQAASLQPAEQASVETKGIGVIVSERFLQRYQLKSRIERRIMTLLQQQIEWLEDPFDDAAYDILLPDDTVILLATVRLSVPSSSAALVEEWKHHLLRMEQQSLSLLSCLADLIAKVVLVVHLEDDGTVESFRREAQLQQLWGFFCMAAPAADLGTGSGRSPLVDIYLALSNVEDVCNIICRQMERARGAVHPGGRRTYSLSRYCTLLLGHQHPPLSPWTMDAFRRFMEGNSRRSGIVSLGRNDNMNGNNRPSDISRSNSSNPWWWVRGLHAVDAWLLSLVFPSWLEVWHGLRSDADYLDAMLPMVPSRTRQRLKNLFVPR